MPADPSRGVRRLLLALLGFLCLAGCTGGIRAPVGERLPPEAAARPTGMHQVRPGESLFSIAWAYGLDYRALARWNGIPPPYRIHPGQRLRLTPPRTPATTPPRRHRPAASVQAPARAATPAGRKGQQRQAARPSPARTPSRRTGPLHWSWPADGPVLQRFDPRRPGKKGILIGGRIGDPVRAAADGRVVYSGSGLVGYGRLIIIKHNNLYLSAYGHNQKLLVKEGDVVHRGQVIARLGSSGTSRPQLHFEIRKRGRPVDPLRYLPRRR
ncbi:MAG: LysM peptidoglycan-binding domain-containing protein [Gammaproteobacteria bacterium]|nr:MAG: LysM peptidoglycan-binding domain-containing protein [Gammaproteobacteria bacterium]